MTTLDDDHAGMMPDAHNTRLLQAALRRYCLSLTQSHWDAEDLAQDTWIKALGYLKNPGSRNMEALLLRIAKNTWIDTLRRKTVFTRILRLQQPGIEAVPDNRGSSEIEAAFQALAEQLSPLQRAVFLIRDVFGHSAQEAADMLNTTEGAVKAALYRARQSLPDVQKELAADGPLWPEDTEYQLHLRRLAVAYEKGQLAELVRLTMLDAAQDTVVAVAMPAAVQALSFGGYPTGAWTGSHPEMGMIA